MFVHEKEVLYEEYENDRVIGCKNIYHENFVECSICAIAGNCPVKDKSMLQMTSNTSVQESIIKNIDWLLQNDPEKVWKSKITEILGRY